MFYVVHVYALFCAPVHVCNVEYFLEVGVCLSQGRFQTTLQITKQLQWRRQCEKEKAKVEEEGVIGPRTMTNVSSISFVPLCSANYLRHALSVKCQYVLVH